MSVLKEQERCHLQQVIASSSPPCSISPSNLSADLQQSDVPADYLVKNANKSSSEASRCACYSTPTAKTATTTRRRCQMIESFSLTEIRSSPVGSMSLLEFEPVQLNRCSSVQGTMLAQHSPYLGGGKSPYSVHHQQQHSRSDSSFNYESNMSEMETNKLVNYFEYRSLESIESPTISDTTMSQQDGEEDDEEEANSTQVNFDEGSTFTSPRDDEPPAVIEDVVDSPALHMANHNPQLALAVNGENNKTDVFKPEVRSTPPPTPATTPVQTSTAGNSPVLSTSTFVCDPLASKPNTTGGGHRSGAKKFPTKSKSARHRRRKTSSTNKKCVSSNEDIVSIVRSGGHHQRYSGDGDHLSHTIQQSTDWSILPIFKQLIVQKQLEQSGGTQSQPIGGVGDDERPTKTVVIEEKDLETQRQMSSCPNLSIKCDVVEYF